MNMDNVNNMTLQNSLFLIIYPFTNFCTNYIPKLLLETYHIDPDARKILGFALIFTAPSSLYFSITQYYASPFYSFSFCMFGCTSYALSIFLIFLNITLPKVLGNLLRLLGILLDVYCILVLKIMSTEIAIGLYFAGIVLYTSGSAINALDKAKYKFAEENPWLFEEIGPLRRNLTLRRQFPGNRAIFFINHHE